MQSARIPPSIRACICIRTGVDHYQSPETSEITPTSVRQCKTDANRPPSPPRPLDPPPHCTSAFTPPRLLALPPFPYAPRPCFRARSPVQFAPDILRFPGTLSKHILAGFLAPFLGSESSPIFGVACIIHILGPKNEAALCPQNWDPKILHFSGGVLGTLPRRGGAFVWGSLPRSAGGWP